MPLNKSLNFMIRKESFFLTFVEIMYSCLGLEKDMLNYMDLIMEFIVIKKLWGHF